MRDISAIRANHLSTVIRAIFSITSLLTVLTVWAPRSVAKELTAAKTAGYIDAAWQGVGDSGRMNVRVVNKTEREWEVEIEVGTKLEPSGSDVQSMVVTRELDVKVHPHESHTFEVEVACLDISKAPPDTSDTAWRVRVTPRLADFIACVNRLIDAEAADASPADAKALRKMKPFILQVGLWQARGATRDQWIDFFVHYQRIPQNEARELATTVEEVSREIVQRCPSL